LVNSKSETDIIEQLILFIINQALALEYSLLDKSEHYKYGLLSA